MTAPPALLAFVGLLVALVVGCSAPPPPPPAPVTAAVPVAPAPLAPPPASPPLTTSPATGTTTTTAKTTTRRSTSATSPYSCEPDADAKLDVDGTITNKDCPALNAAKEAAQREYLEQLRGEAAVREERDGNGETYAEYCNRTGQSVESCNAG